MKKVNILSLGIFLFLSLFSSDLLAKKAFVGIDTSGGPRIIRTNWLNPMSNGCIVLRGGQALGIGTYITIADLNLSSYPSLYYSYNFDGQTVGTIGPMSPSDFESFRMSSGEFLYQSEDFFEIYYPNACPVAPGDPDPIPFSYEIQLLTMTSQGLVPYPVDDYPTLFPRNLFPADQMNTEVGSQTNYINTNLLQGNKFLCCELESNGGAENEYLNTQISLNNSATNQQAVQLYPNPFNEEMTIAYEVEKGASVVINIWDANGRLVHQVNKNQVEKGHHQISINTKKWPAGFYYASIQSSQSDLQTIKLLKLNP